MTKIDYFLISAHHVVVNAEKQLEILDVLTGKILIEKYYTPAIKYVCSNISKQHASTETSPHFQVFIVVVLANGEINLYSFDTGEQNLNLNCFLGSDSRIRIWICLYLENFRIPGSGSVLIPTDPHHCGGGGGEFLNLNYELRSRSEPTSTRQIFFLGF